jgi:hypothetical protein
MNATPRAASAASIQIEQGRYAGRTGKLLAVNTSRGLASMRLDDGSQVIVQLANMLPAIRAYFYAHGWQAATDVYGEPYVRAAMLPTD